MSLEDTIKELKEQIAVAEKEEAKPEEVVEEVAPEPVPEPAPEVTPEPAPEPVKEEELDNKGYAKLRRDKAAAEKKAEELAKELEALRAAPKVEEAGEAAPVEVAIDPEIEELKHERRITKAEREFLQYESKFKEKVTDYDGVAAEYIQAIGHSIRVQNPKLSPVELAEKTKFTILAKAGEYVRQGYDPIEELYHEAKELGFTGKSSKKEVTAEEVKEDIKPDMKKLAANRARSTNMTATSGKSEGQVTKQAAADYTNDEWSKLPVAEKKRLMYG